MSHVAHMNESCHTCSIFDRVRHNAPRSNIQRHTSLLVATARIRQQHTATQTATRCNKLQQTATHGTMNGVSLEYVRIHRQHTASQTAIDCNTRQHSATDCNTGHHQQHCAWDCAYLSAAYCNTLQYATARCNTLQHAATHCNTLQHAATRCNARQHQQHCA